MAPGAVHIGFSRCGGAWLAGMFRRSGFVVRHNLGGRLAQDAAFARLAGTVPFQPWPDAAFVGHLESATRFHTPLLEPFRDVGWLATALPEAVFLLPTRPVEDWIASRLAHDSGLLARRHAAHHGCALADLPDLWAGEWDAHLAAARLACGDRLVCLDLEQAGFADWRDALAPWFRLTTAPPGPGPAVAQRRRAALRTAAAMIGAPPTLPFVLPQGRQGRAADRLARFALKGLGPGRPDGDMTGLGPVSEIAAFWDGAATVSDREGEPLPILRRACAREPFLAPPVQRKLDRVVGVLNEAVSLGAAQPLLIDMQDARRLGTGTTPAAPILGYCRRAGARNVVLWPLPGLHTPGDPAFVSDETPDPIAWEDKRDLAVWRGDLSGQERRADGSHGLGTPALLAALAGAGDGADAARLAARLATVPRLAFLDATAGSPDLDAGLVLSDLLAPHAGLPQVARHLTGRQPPAWFHGFRYILSLPGYDSGSNFLTAANTRSVVLKEEDGWELFYTPLFRPWREYIPLAPGGVDFAAQLAWARANEDACRTISAAARAACRVLACAATRRRMLASVLRGLAENPPAEGLPAAPAGG